MSVSRHVRDREPVPYTNHYDPRLTVYTRADVFLHKIPLMRTAMVGSGPDPAADSDKWLTHPHRAVNQTCGV